MYPTTLGGMKMPKFKVECSSKHSAQESFGKVKALLDQDKDLRKLDPAFKVSYDEQKLAGSAKGGKFDAEIKVKASGNGSHVEIEVSLPMLLAPVKSVVQSTIEKKLNHALA